MLNKTSQKKDNKRIISLEELRVYERLQLILEKQPGSVAAQAAGEMLNNFNATGSFGATSLPAPRDGTLITAHYNGRWLKVSFDQTAFNNKGGWFTDHGEAKPEPKSWLFF